METSALTDARRASRYVRLAYPAEGGHVGFIADQFASPGNMSEDPLFCRPSEGNYSIVDNSPCAAGLGSLCGLIGAVPVGCGPIGLNAASWASIKARYR